MPHASRVPCIWNVKNSETYKINIAIWYCVVSQAHTFFILLIWWYFGELMLKIHWKLEKEREKMFPFVKWTRRQRGSLFKYATKTVYSSEFSLSAARPIIYSYMCLLRIDFTQHKLTVRMSKQHCNANFQFHSWQKWASERVSEQNKTKQDKEEKTTSVDSADKSCTVGQNAFAFEKTIGKWLGFFSCRKSL